MTLFPKTSILLLIAVPLFPGASCLLLAQPAPFGPGQVRGTVQDPRLTEISGVVASRRQSNVLWVHNDSGNRAEVYALSQEGVLLATCRVQGAQARDWEDIALGPGPDPAITYLYLGDIGDNRARYPTIHVYRTPEPNLASRPASSMMDTEPCEKIELAYPDGPQDAETLVVDPVTGDLYIVSKRHLFSHVYHAQAPLVAGEAIPLVLVTLLPWGLATGGDISTDGGLVVFRGPSHAMIWQRPEQGPLWANLRHNGKRVPLQSEPQGEAICFGTGNRSLLTLSEGMLPPIYEYPIQEPNTISPGAHRQ